MVRAYHFFPDDMRAAEDIVAGLDEPWRIGDTRRYTAVKIGSGDGEFITESGYQSSPTLWDALLQANGPIACLVEVSPPLSISNSCEEPSAQSSEVRTLIAAVDVRAELRRFACDCAERVLSLYEDLYPKDGRLRDAIAVARRFADAAASSAELQAALVSIRDAADVASGQARMAAFSAFGTTLREAHDAALTAARSAMWAVDGRTTPGPERVWQRAHFDQLFAHLFAS
jgi:immunity protein 5 of polymorphic toxin system